MAAPSTLGRRQPEDSSRSRSNLLVAQAHLQGPGLGEVELVVGEQPPAVCLRREKQLGATARPERASGDCQRG